MEHTVHDDQIGLEIIGWQVERFEERMPEFRLSVGEVEAPGLVDAGDKAEEAGAQDAFAVEDDQVAAREAGLKLLRKVGDGGVQRKIASPCSSIRRLALRVEEVTASSRLWH